MASIEITSEMFVELLQENQSLRAENRELKDKLAGMVQTPNRPTITVQKADEPVDADATFLKLWQSTKRRKGQGLCLRFRFDQNFVQPMALVVPGYNRASAWRQAIRLVKAERLFVAAGTWALRPKAECTKPDHQNETAKAEFIKWYSAKADTFEAVGE